MHSFLRKKNRLFEIYPRDSNCLGRIEAMLRVIWCGRAQCYTTLMKAHVWVMPKRTVLDPQGQTIQHALSGLGYSSVRDVRQGKFFVLRVEGLTHEEASKQVERISKEVLTNPVIEESRFEIVD